MIEPPGGFQSDSERPLRASKEVFAKGNREERVRHLRGRLESGGREAGRERAGQVGAGDRVSATAEHHETRTRSADTATWRVAEDLGKTGAATVEGVAVIMPVVFAAGRLM